MKTKSQNTKTAPGLRVQSSNHHSEPTAETAAATAVAHTPAPAQTPPTPERPPVQKINFARRRANRDLGTEQLLSLLRNEAPRFYELAEVVGKWVWIHFTDKQPPKVTSVLAELGFHWNNARQTWQHPCGALTQGSPNDPREKYGSRHPADLQPA